MYLYVQNQQDNCIIPVLLKELKDCGCWSTVINVDISDDYVCVPGECGHLCFAVF